jgi:hypothetical protein
VYKSRAGPLLRFPRSLYLLRENDGTERGGVLVVLWGAVGTFVPGIDYPHPTLAQQVPVLVAGTTSFIGPRVGRVETDERTRLTVSAGTSLRCRCRPRGARR